MRHWFALSPFIAVFLAFSAQAIPHLDGGTPGCLQLILEHPMSDEQAKHLTSNCADLRQAYLASLKIYGKHWGQFEKEVGKSLRSNQKAIPAYRAILMATLFEHQKLVPALEARAKIEKAKKLPYAYAAAAVERLKKGSCSKLYVHPAYDEVCRLRSPVARRVVELSAPIEVSR